MEPEEDFTIVLLDDLIAATQGVEKSRPHERRSAVRTMFAAIEGHLADLSQELLEKASGDLSEVERMALQEVTYRVTESGRIDTTRARQSLKQRVKLLTRIVNRLHPEYEIDFQSEGWQQLVRGLDVRHRLTHPKCREDLEIGEQKMKAVIAGTGWFFWVVMAPGHRGIAAYLEKRAAERDSSPLFAPGGFLSRAFEQSGTAAKPAAKHAPDEPDQGSK